MIYLISLSGLLFAVAALLLLGSVVMQLLRYARVIKKLDKTLEISRGKVESKKKRSATLNRDSKDYTNAAASYWLVLLVVSVLVGTMSAKAEVPPLLPEPVITEEVYKKVSDADPFDPQWGSVTHWLAAGWTLLVMDAELGRSRIKTLEALTRFCDQLERFETGAPSRALWKPQSERSGRPVMLLPANWLGSWVTAYDYSLGFWAGDLVPAGVQARPGLENENRAHWDFANLPASVFPKPTLIVAKRPDGAQACWILNNPEQRIERP
jgi:hypothetical protein